MGDLTRNFSKREFRCPCGCSSRRISILLVARLQIVRNDIDEAINITSGIRCRTHNKAVGGLADSAHLEGDAADIRIPDSRYRFRIMPHLLRLFKRIGMYETFVHVDVAASSTKPRNVLWMEVKENE